MGDESRKEILRDERVVLVSFTEMKRKRFSMNNLQTTIFNLIDAALHQKTDAEVTLPKNTDWNEIYEELSNQSVIGIPLEYMVNNIDAPKEITDHWKVMVYSQVAQWTKLMEAQTKLIKLLQDNDIPVAIIKGAAAAMNYPKAEYRSMGDIDFVVNDKDYKKAFELMRANGYDFAADEAKAERHLEEEKFYHVELKKGGILFELHRRMSPTAQGEDIDQMVEDRMKEGLNHIETGKVGEYEFPMFEKKLNGLIILRHIIQHLSDAKGVGLRHVIDWMVFVEENVDDDFWQSEFADYLDEVHLTETAAVFAKIGKMYLGMDKSITWCDFAEDETCVAWMEQVMEGGNFGKKTNKTTEGARVMYKNKNLFTLIGSLQELGLEHWEPARKHKVLRPFAWAYQAGRYARKGLGRKAPIKSLKQDMEKGKYKKELLDKLNI